jgi:hypothetical protein
MNAGSKLALLILISCASACSISTAPLSSSPCLSVLESGAKKTSYGGISITGRIQNSCDQRFEFVQVQFKLYSNIDELLGNALDNVQGLGPHEIWAFTTTANVPGAYRFELDYVAGR